MRQAALTLLASLSIAAVGCGGTALAPSIDDATSPILAQVVFRVTWPATARTTPAGTAEIVVQVTGPGIGAPIEGTLSPPETELTLWVPVGDNRDFAAWCYDTNGAELAHGERNGVTIEAGTENRLSITLTVTETGRLLIGVDWTDAPADVSAAIDWDETDTGTANITVDWQG